MIVIQQIINGLAQTALALAMFTGCDARPPDATVCWATIPQDDGGYTIIYGYADDSQFAIRNSQLTENK
jgi:predicted carbohydrate-binding protein with CBM5 and CBM33 domain